MVSMVIIMASSLQNQPFMHANFPDFSCIGNQHRQGILSAGSLRCSLLGVQLVRTANIHIVQHVVILGPLAHLQEFTGILCQQAGVDFDLLQ